jgi:hypothetical protein
MTQKAKKAAHHNNHEEEILMSQPEKGNVYSMALYLRSFLVIAVVVIMFAITCHFSFILMDLLTPLLKVGLGLFFAYILITNEHFQPFRQSLLNPEYGPKTLWIDFIKGFENSVGDYLGHDWLQKILTQVRGK